MTATEGQEDKGAARLRDADRLQWSRYLSRAIREGNLDGLEAAVWAASARYAEWPTRDRERELKRAARAYGIQPPT